MLLQGSPRSRPIQRGQLRTVKGHGPLAKVSLTGAREAGNGALHRFVQSGEPNAVSPQPGGGAQGLPSAEVAKLQLRPDPQRARVGSDQGAVKIKEGNRHADSVTRIVSAAREVSVEALASTLGRSSVGEEKYKRPPTARPSSRAPRRSRTSVARLERSPEMEAPSGMRRK